MPGRISEDPRKPSEIEHRADTVREQNANPRVVSSLKSFDNERDGEEEREAPSRHSRIEKKTPERKHVKTAVDTIYQQWSA